jgi:hypothetical protein
MDIEALRRTTVHRFPPALGEFDSFSDVEHLMAVVSWLLGERRHCAACLLHKCAWSA